MSIEFKHISQGALDILSKPYESREPFPHVVIDNFVNPESLPALRAEMDEMKQDLATDKFIKEGHPFQYNKYGYTKGHGKITRELFGELSSECFVKQLETLTGIKGLICNETDLKGAGIHRSFNGGYLGMHADFNMYQHDRYGVIDRRINVLIYLNDEWKDEYNGELLLADFKTKKIVKSVKPIMNRAVIFNTTSKSLHGHPVPLNTPASKSRDSIAMYYYTKNEASDNKQDFEGLAKHTTIFHPFNEFKRAHVA